MKFFIGVLSLVVILATFGAPAIFVFGWGALTANDRHAITKTIHHPIPNSDTSQYRHRVPGWSWPDSYPGCGHYRRIALVEIFPPKKAVNNAR